MPMEAAAPAATTESMPNEEDEEDKLLGGNGWVLIMFHV